MRYPNVTGLNFQNLDVPLNISAMAEGSVFKFDKLRGFAKSIIKTHPIDKVGVAHG